MKDSTLLKLSLASSLIGLSILLGMTEFLQPSPITIDQASDKLDEFVYVEGVVKTITYKPESVFITLADSTDEILVVLFDSIEKSISENDRIGVSGEVSLYRGREEILADRIFCIKCGV